KKVIIQMIFEMFFGIDCTTGTVNWPGFSLVICLICALRGKLRLSLTFIVISFILFFGWFLTFFAVIITIVNILTCSVISIFILYHWEKGGIRRILEERPDTPLLALPLLWLI